MQVMHHIDMIVSDPVVRGGRPMIVGKMSKQRIQQ